MTENEALERVKSLVGWPEIPVIQEDKNIIKFHINPAIKQYYKWYPLIHLMDVPASGQAIADPPKNSIGIISAEFLKYEAFGSASAAIPYMEDPFAIARVYRRSSNGNQSYFQTTIQERFARDSIRSYNQVQKVQYSEGKIKVFSNVPSICALRIAMIGDLASIPQDKEDIYVLFAAISFIKKEAIIRGTTKMNNGLDVNAEELSALADKLQEELDTRKNKILNMIAMWN